MAQNKKFVEQLAKSTFQFRTENAQPPEMSSKCLTLGFFEAISKIANEAIKEIIQ